MVDDDYILKLLEEIEAKHAAQKLKLENPYALDLIRVLLPFPNGLRRQQVIGLMRFARKKKNLDIPIKFEETIQSAFQQYCADSDVFRKSKKDPSEALFHWPAGKGAGRWALYLDRAERWLRERQSE